MSKSFLLGCLAGLLLQTACQPNASAPAKAPLTAQPSTFTKKTCGAQPEQCASIELKYFEFAGGEATVATAVNDSIRHFMLASVGGNHALPFKTALDSAAAEFAKGYFEGGSEIPVFIEANTTVLLQNSKILSLALSENSYQGGAHPNSATILYTFDLSSGKVAGITDLVKDTTMLLPLLEAGFRKAKEMKPGETLADYLYPDLKSLPLSQFVCVVPAGLRFFYNPYEVGPYAIGSTDITLTWEELGKLADKSRWIE